MSKSWFGQNWYSGISNFKMRYVAFITGKKVDLKLSEAISLRCSGRMLFWKILQNLKENIYTGVLS